jgi:hypothetical protein
MDDDLQKFENELRELRPVAPARTLMARIECELARDESAPPAARAWWLWAGALPAAAALAVMVAMAVKRSEAPRIDEPRPAAESQALLKPVAAENILYAARDEGLVTLDDGTPARRARLSYVDTFIWENPRTNASLKWSVPREEIRVVPVSFQ